MNKLDYVPENPAEELFELIGRVKAFTDYVNVCKFAIDRETCAAILGFELKEEKEDAKDNCPDGDFKLD